MIVATTHINSDTDALASLVALRRIVGEITLVLPGAMDVGARRFFEEHETELPPISPLRDVLGRLETEPAELLHVVDTASLDRLGPLGEVAARFREILAWDTHPAAEGDLPRAPMAPASACVSGLVIELERRGLRPPPVEAGLFLVGIHEDTGHFTFPETAAADHRAASVCLDWGADPRWPERYCPRGFTAEQLTLMEKMAESVRYVDRARSPIAVLTLELDRYVPELASLLGQLRAAEAWPAAFLVASLAGRLYVIGRSDGQFDVSAVLRPLGGGGRPSAASASLRGATLPGAIELVIDAIGEQCGARRTAGELAVRRFVDVSADETVREAADVMHRYSVNALPVREAAGEGAEYIAVVSRQEVDAAIRHGLAERPVREIAARSPLWISEDAGLGEARARLLDGAGRLLLVGEPPGRVVGLLTRTAVLLAGSEEVSLAPPRRGPHPSVLLQMARRSLGDQWPLVEMVGQLASGSGMSAHLVGGSVRDVLLERPAKDVDVVIEGDAIRLASEARSRAGGELSVHEPFGTATWKTHAGNTIDFATARAEYYESPASLPRVLHAELRRDLFRRDFTINAMAITIDPNEAGILRDPHNGYDDLKNRFLRVIHGLSFHDDPTRAFRAARFAARFDFRLAPQTSSLLRAAIRAGVFTRLTRERLGQEIETILAEREVEQALRLLREWHLLEQVHPQLRPGADFFAAITSVQNSRYELQGIWRALEASDPVPTQADALWVVLARELPRGERATMARLVPGPRERRRRWRSGPERVREALDALASAATAADAALALEDLDRTERVVTLGLAPDRQRREALRWWEREGRLVRSAVDGERLLALGARPGPALGRALRAAQRAAWNGADGDEQLAAARRTLAEDNGGAGE
jgi:tRNA nucleotidyltransferase (CCA-adding enzyme)